MYNNHVLKSTLESGTRFTLNESMCVCDVSIQNILQSVEFIASRCRCEHSWAAYPAHTSHHHTFCWLNSWLLFISAICLFANMFSAASSLYNHRQYAKHILALSQRILNIKMHRENLMIFIASVSHQTARMLELNGVPK